MLQYPSILDWSLASFFSIGILRRRDVSYMILLLKVETRILENERTKAQYFTIPAHVVQDSQYPFKANDIVELEIDPDKEILTLRLLRRSSAAKK